MPGKRKALLIGVADYEDERIADLPIVRQDLTTLQTALEDSEFETEIIGLEAQQAPTGFVKIQRRLENVCLEAKGVETLILYFSGHGLHYEGQDYLVPSDASIRNPNDLKYLIPVDIAEIVEQSPAQTVIWVIDACREGIKLEAKSIGLGQWSRSDIKLAGKKQFAVIYSCDAGQYSRFSAGDNGFSLFTQAFAETLDPEHAASTLDEVIQATQARLDQLCTEHNKAHQKIKARYEDDAAGTLRNWVICQGAPPLLPEPSREIRRQLAVPFPSVKLPQNFVARPQALDTVKQTLLGDNAAPLVVSAISGLGGIGKSVLAAALVLDQAIQARFSDGILWVTLGQNPDLQTMLAKWIRELDTSRDSYSANTVEAASKYLENLLADKQMLLVVDDVWFAEHAEWFQVGGPNCRVLVTTREAQLAGANYYRLDLMTEAEAIALVQNKLGAAWSSEQETDVKAFAQAVGYLPLALDLATNQIQDGLSWAELLEEFQSNRRTIALELLDSSEAWEQLDAEKRRKYSLQACFELSLKRLNELQKQQFTWLGVLPEDVNIEAAMAAVLWNVRPLQAKKILINFRNRSFLTDGVATGEGNLTYRLHDLMHDMAQGLIQGGEPE